MTITSTELYILMSVNVVQGFILGFYVCYSGWVIGGKDSTFNIMSRWGWVQKLGSWFRK